MQRLARLTVMAALISPTVASGQDYSFGDWARDQGYEPGDVMPWQVGATGAGIDSLDGISEFDWTTTPTIMLWLWDNQLTSIESGDFDGLTHLTALGLSGNQLTSIESGDLVGLTNLTSLDLWRNQLSSIEAGVFDGLTNLATLDLFGNHLSSVELGVFDGLTNLTTLHLNDNQISSIEPGAFDGLTNLAELYLYPNELSSIEHDTFAGLANLTHLFLSSNQLSSVESGDFSELVNLAKLSLTCNQISDIELGAFDGLTDLTELGLGSNQLSDIESGVFDGLTNLQNLELSANRLSSVESGDFSGLTNLHALHLDNNQLSSIESRAFSELMNLERLILRGNAALTELNLEAADFSSLTAFDVGDNVNTGSVSLANAVLNQSSIARLLDGGVYDVIFGTEDGTGIGELDGITKMDLSGIDFSQITDLSPLYVMDDLTALWFVNTQNVDATALDVLLDNLETIESPDTEGVLYMTRADHDAFNAAGGDLLSDWNDQEGHHVEFLQIGDVNHDTEVNGLDVDPFVDVLLSSRFDVAADMNSDGVVNGLDVDAFVTAVVGGGKAAVPEPSTLLLCLVALTMVSSWRKWRW